MKAVAVIPAYEPTLTLVAVAEGLLREGFGDIVVVDDGSSAASAEAFNRLALLAGCTVLRHARNRGKGAALKTAFQYVREKLPSAEVIVTVDADAQHLPADCRRLKEALETADARSYGLGVRNFSLASTPFRSWWGNRWSALAFAILFRRWVPDTQTGLRAFRREALEFFLALPGDGYEYEMACLGLSARAGYSFRTMTISTIYEAGNASSHFHPLRDALRIHNAMFKAWLYPRKKLEALSDQR